MAMSLPRPSAVGQRPAYLDNLFRDMPNASSVHSSTSSISTSSTAPSYDLHSAYYNPKTLSPPLEEGGSDTTSIRSKKSFMRSPRRFKLGSLLYRRTYPQTEQPRVEEIDRPVTAQGLPQKQIPLPPQSPPPEPPVELLQLPVELQRRPSLPKLQTNFPPPRAVSIYAKKALPAVPTQSLPRPPPQVEAGPPPRSLSKTKRPKMDRQPSTGELSCQRCYYFAARNCNGYVLGGEAGDACEMCLQAGFFGAK